MNTISKGLLNFFSIPVLHSLSILRNNLGQFKFYSANRLSNGKFLCFLCRPGLITVKNRRSCKCCSGFYLRRANSWKFLWLYQILLACACCDSLSWIRNLEIQLTVSELASYMKLTSQLIKRKSLYYWHS